MKHKPFFLLLIGSILMLAASGLLAGYQIATEYYLYGPSYEVTTTIKGSSTTVTVTLDERILSLGFVLWLGFLLMYCLVLIYYPEHPIGEIKKLRQILSTF